MKKILSVLLTIAIVISMVSVVGVFTASAATSGQYTYEIKSGNAVITDVNTSISGDVTIPATLGGRTVTGIGEYAFYECNRITSVTIPNGVTNIERAAFGFCQNLVNVVLPMGITAIADGTFSDCARLEEVNIPSSVKKIGELAFSNCDGLKSIKIPDNVEEIGGYAFAWCNRLSKVEIGNGVLKIDEGTFYECLNLTDVILGNNVTEIGTFAFKECKALGSIDISDSVKTICNSTFENCIKLSSVKLPIGIEAIDAYAFDGCSKLEDVWYGGNDTEKEAIDIGYYNEYLTDAQWHYEICEENKHTYQGNCLNGCINCGWVPDSHTYVNACDTKCNGCGKTRSVKSHTYSECFNGYAEELYEGWSTSVTKTGVYTLKPNSKYTGDYSIHNIAVFDKDGKEVFYYEKLGGFPLVAGQSYTVKFRYDCSDEISGTIAWTKTRKADTIFPDTSASEWYNDAVTYAVGSGIMSGYASNGKFGTSDSIQRQDFLVMLARLDGVDLTSYGNMKSKVPDVEEGSYYEAAVNWGAQKGIVGGYDNGKFGTGDKITREQLVTFLHRYAAYKGYDDDYSASTEKNVKSQYSDYKNVSSFANAPILWAIEKGVIKGKNDTTIAPQGNAQRCEVAQIMYNIFLNDIF